MRETYLAARRKVSIRMARGGCGEVQFSAHRSSPGGALPILSRWCRIVRTSAGSVISAMSLNSDPHRGQSKESTSETFTISLAQAERQAACGTVVGSRALACGDIGSA
jgi:hypothetical protein